MSTDANGVVLFDPHRLREWLGVRADEAQDLLNLFLTSEAGDENLAKGIIVPILAIDDGGYDVIIRDRSESSLVSEYVIVENGSFPLFVDDTLVVADVLVLREWTGSLEDCVATPWKPGNYGVNVRGFQLVGGEPRALLAAGYELVLEAQAALPAVTGQTGKNMRVLNWWDRET